MIEHNDYRFDYARIRVATDQDVAMQRTEHLKELIQLWAEQGVDTAGGNYQFRVFPGGTASERQYCLELWGPLAELVTWLDFTEWGDRCMRLDVRKDLLSGTEASIMAFGDKLAEKNGRLNLARYRSKGRSKRGGRNAGGTGVALGSHKSIYRASVYKRHGEPAAMEFQWSGAAVQSKVMGVHALSVPPAMCDDPWGALRRSLLVDGQRRLEKASGMNYSQVLDILFNVRDERQPERYEQLEMSIRQDFFSLPKDRQAQLWNSIEATGDF